MIREVIVVKEVMAGDVLPVVMFYIYILEVALLFYLYILESSKCLTIGQ